MSHEYVDVIIVGAGLSGIGAAYHLQEKCPHKRYVILEGRGAMGGTWDLFRYPGIRSDSDMHTLGYNFKPWLKAKAIADGPSILNYVQETAAENEISQHIRYNHMVKSADWSSQDQSWTITATQKETGAQVELRCNFLLMCAGYYSYEEGYTPDFNGRDRFNGPIIHPQKWPVDLDYKDKKVVVIGSGATAVTLIPSMADDTAHITMLQRSPSYIASVPEEDKAANILRKIFPKKVAYAITRWKNITYQQLVYRRSRTHPEEVKEQLLGLVRQELGDDYDVATHFTPAYNPWDQRLCAIPNGDLFEALKAGKASVVTDHIDTFTENGILLRSGQELEADIIITATGLNVTLLGGMVVYVDGQPVNAAERFTYKGTMISDIPNMIAIFGYVNASWTLRADLMSEFACRLLQHMDRTATKQCTPRLRQSDKDMAQQPWIDDFSSNYLHRVMHQLPKQGDRQPWTNPQDYKHDKKMFRRGALEDGVLIFE